MRFSDYYSLGLSQPELDFVDVKLDGDTHLFLDPYAVSIRVDDWSARCNEHIVSFFQTTVDYIRHGNIARAQLLLDGLSEPNETRLGLSQGNPQGRGVSGKQARDLYSKLAASRAAHTGILTEISECDLFVNGIGRDKISDMTTNIIRGLLIEYTQEQCHVHDIPLSGYVTSGRIWDIEKQRWRQEYVQLPIVSGKKVLLVPKASVRFRLSLDSQEYYDHFVLNYLQVEHLQAHSSLVQVLKNGRMRVTKKNLKQRYPKNKNWLAEFSENHPNVLEKYKEFRRKAGLYKDSAAEAILNEDDFDEALFAKSLADQLMGIPAGRGHAYEFHKLIVGILEFLFWPYLIYPRIEHPIHEGRKKIDITYTNAATEGFFFRLPHNRKISSGKIMVECKNYWEDPKNPEIDQLAGRFSINRGRFGFFVCRNVEDEEGLRKRCRDNADDDRGFIIVLGNKEILRLLGMIESDNRRAMDSFLDQNLDEIIS